MLRLGRHARARAGALHVEHDERKLDGHRETNGFHLEREARAARRRDAEAARVRRADRRAHRRDLVFGLHGGHAELLVSAELVEHVARRRDRVRAEDEIDRAEFRGRDSPHAVAVLPEMLQYSPFSTGAAGTS